MTHYQKLAQKERMEKYRRRYIHVLVLSRKQYRVEGTEVVKLRNPLSKPVIVDRAGYPVDDTNFPGIHLL